MLTASHLHKEIYEQPLVLRAVLEQERGRIAALAADIVERDVDYVMIAARGTSDNAGRYAQYLLGAYGGLPVALATPSLFSIYGQAPRLRNALVLGISQSGRSPDIVSVLAEARRQGALTAALTNYADSDLAQQADHVIGLNAGEERSVAATKTYTAELMAIAMLGAALNGRDEMTEMLATVPEKVAAVLEGGERVAQVVEHFKTMSSCVAIGRGYNYATAFELALKLEELTYTLAMSYSSADFLHGPVALIEKDFPVVLIAPSGTMLPDQREFLGTVQAKGAQTIVISDHSDLLGMAHYPLPLPSGLPEWLSPITAIVPGQLFAMYLAAARDFDPDRPRGLSKVTETR